MDNDIEEAAKLRVEIIMANDPSVVDVVLTMRAQGRSWGKILSCLLRSQLEDNRPN